jgi:hypothetical protein
MDAKELLRMNVTKLRAEALKLPDVVGVTAMKKEALIELLATAQGIVLEPRSHPVEISDIKKHIRVFKTRRNEALARKAYKEAAQIRRSIRTLKRRSRVLARAAKMQPQAAS